MEKEYTLTIYTEHYTGLLHRITIIFTRRKLNILSIAASVSEVPDIYRYTVVVKTTESQVEKVINQIEKTVGVIRAFANVPEDIVYQEIALYKVPTHIFANSDNVERIVRAHGARILNIEREYIVIEKTGHQEETRALYQELEPFGILAFVRSGRIALMKDMRELHDYIKEIEEAHH